MLRVLLGSPSDFGGWRDVARRLILESARPDDIVWSIEGEIAGAFDFSECLAEEKPAAAFTVPRSFFDLAQKAILHRDSERFALLYQLLWRLREEPGLMEIAVDPLVSRLAGMAKAVRRDIHKMHAFVRFRAIETEQGETFIAWFEPDHHIVEEAASFFQRRFAAMRWSILTPERSAHWDGAALLFAEGAEKAAAPSEDKLEELWRTYYASIFNPARLKVEMMRSEMPEKYWKNLPEARLIKPLINAAARMTTEMTAAEPLEPRLRPQRSIRKMDQHAQSPSRSTIVGLRHEAMDCRACPLWAPATQTVFGEGPEDAEIVFVGEQPGDSEDLVGRPFVGPAGKLLDKALAEAGVDRARAYVTNAVKHFKFEPRGKRRLHKKPNTGEIHACRSWLMRELDVLRPKLVVALGATAIQGVTGHAMPINANRGEVFPLENGGRMLVTVHPSYLLRLPGVEEKALEYARFVEDLRQVRRLLAR